MAANLVEYTRPVFSSPSYLSFTAGVPSTRTISATGNPKPTVFVDENGGTLTSNSDFTITIGQGTPDFNTVRIEFNGNSNAPAGDYTLNLNAQPGLPVHQTYTITVGNELRITSPDTLNGTAGSPLNFLVTATGSPTPKLSIDPEALVNGLTFTDNGNGTATISGVAPLPGEFKCVKVDLEYRHHSSVRNRRQQHTGNDRAAVHLQPGFVSDGERRTTNRRNLHGGRRESGSADVYRCDDPGIMGVLSRPVCTLAQFARHWHWHRRAARHAAAGNHGYVLPRGCADSPWFARHRSGLSGDRREHSGVYQPEHRDLHRG